jgi:hypothetical protein
MRPNTMKPVEIQADRDDFEIETANKRTFFGKHFSFAKPPHGSHQPYLKQQTWT